MDAAAAELGRNPVSKHHIQPEYGDEQGDARRDNQTSREAKLSGANGDKEIFIFPWSADHEQDWQPYPADPYFCYMVCDRTIQSSMQRRQRHTINNLVMLGLGSGSSMY